MYKTIVVEDEPVAQEHICAMLSRYFPQFEIVAKAANGADALPLVAAHRPDLVITDVKMPVMDGLDLAHSIHRDYPDVCIVIISGYQEFNYAREALKNNVFDYLLKPISPATLRHSMELVEQKLKKHHGAMQAVMLRDLSRGMQMEADQLVRYFPSPVYYAALVRKNGLPRRFSVGGGNEIFSYGGELMGIYGRDEMESLCVCPADKLAMSEFEQMMNRMLENSSPGCQTLVLYPTAFSPDELPRIIRKIFTALGESLTVGKNCVVWVGSHNPHAEEDIKIGQTAALMEIQLKNGNIDALKESFEQILSRWNGYPQSIVECAVKQIFLHLRANGGITFYDNLDFLVEDAFFFAATHAELMENLIDILCKSFPKSLSAANKIDTPAFFGKIRDYVDEHLSEPLMLQSLCVSFGISQTYLSRLFRKHTGHSFNEYLTLVRMDRAKVLLLENSDMLVREIAALVGYNDQFYFSRLFRSVTGVTPTEYVEEIH